MAVNNVTLVGRITKDPVIRTTATGIKTCTFFLAVDRQINRKTAPEGTQTADFITCVVWRGTAEFMEKYVRKGDLLSIEGRLATRTYEKDGHTVFVTEVQTSRLTKESWDNHREQNMNQTQVPYQQTQPMPQQNVAQQPMYQNQPQYQPNPNNGYPPQAPNNGYQQYPQNPAPQYQQNPTQNGQPRRRGNQNNGLDIVSDDLPF